MRSPECSETSIFTIIALIAFIGCILVMTQNCVQGNLLQPILEIYTDDAMEADMVGSTVYLNCTNSFNGKSFYLRKHGSDDIIQEQPTPVFTITNLSKRDNGLYTCQYRMDSQISELSDPVYLYANEFYPPPTITAEPQSIVRPGQDVTIMCNSSYPNIVFTLFKGNSQIVEQDTNPLIHVIHNMNEEHAGQYSCRYKKLNIQSHFSNPLMIDVKDLPRPSITWEPDREEKLNISCLAPETAKRMWFQLLNESKDVIAEIKDIKRNEVDFIVPYREQSYPVYYCIYRIRMGSSFADSLISDAAIIGEDYTMVNIIRLLLSMLILVLMAVIAGTCFKIYQRRKTHPPELPAPRERLAVESDYTMAEVIKIEDMQENSPTLTVQTDYKDESCDGKEAKEVMPMVNADSLEKSVDLTPPTTAVYAVIEKVIDPDEQQTCL